jgi:hypothetical protein
MPVAGPPGLGGRVEQAHVVLLPRNADVRAPAAAHEPPTRRAARQRPRTRRRGHPAPPSPSPSRLITRAGRSVRRCHAGWRRRGAVCGLPRCRERGRTAACACRSAYRGIPARASGLFAARGSGADSPPSGVVWGQAGAGGGELRARVGTRGCGGGHGGAPCARAAPRGPRAGSCAPAPPPPLSRAGTRIALQGGCSS